MINNSYEAKTTKSFDNSRTLRELQEYERRSMPVSDTTPTNIPEFARKKLSELDQIISVVDGKDLPLFSHPLLGERRNGELQRIYFDARPFVRYNKLGRETIATNVTDYSFNLARVLLENIWVNEPENRRNLLNMSTFPLKLFTVFVSNEISRIYNLGLGEQGAISTIVAAWYISSHLTAAELDKFDVQVYGNRIARITKNNPRMVIETLQRLSPMYTVDDFIANIQTNSGSSRTESFSYGLLVNAIAGSWFGTYAREIMPIAMEFPPTWISIAAGSTKNAYQKTKVGRTANMIFSKDDITEFSNRIQQRLYGA